MNHFNQVANIGAKLSMTESQLTTAKCQNQGLKSLLKKMENKLKATHQESREKNMVTYSLFPYGIFTWKNIGTD